MLAAPQIISRVHQDDSTNDPQQTVTFVFIINLQLWQMLNIDETRNGLTAKKL
jgi:hypothetical protein